MKLNILRPFARSERGGLSVEAVFAIPLLVWAITATFVFWDAFKTLNVSQKATYTIADMLSRETQTIDADYLTAMHEVFAFLSLESGGNALRVTVVTITQDPDTLVKTMELVWSKGVGGIQGYDGLETIAKRIPDFAAGDQMIIVESEQEWAPAFAVGLASYRFREVAITRPRFAPQLVWTDGVAGAGNV
jgi:hypothetical protein